MRRPPRATLLPYTTLYRSGIGQRRAEGRVGEQPRQAGRVQRRLWLVRPQGDIAAAPESDVREQDRKSTRLNSSHANISYAVFCLKKTTKNSITIGPSHDFT